MPRVPVGAYLKMKPDILPYEVTLDIFEFGLGFTHAWGPRGV